MQPKALKYIYDIQASAEKIRRFVAGKSLESYLAYELLQSAVERQFEIIGEAVNLLCKKAPEIAREIPDYQKMISFRNLLIHGYASVDSVIVWGVVESSLDSLLQHVSQLLDEHD